MKFKTLFNIVEAPFKIVELWCLCYNDDLCSDGPINCQEYNSFEMCAVTIEIHVYMTE